VALVLIPLPRRDFDPTEVAVSWQVLAGQGHEVHFATPDGSAAEADDLMVTGRGLDPWGFVPGLSRLVGIGRVLRADARARAAHARLLRAPSFVNPMVWAEVTADDFDGLLLPGGHRARGMREYLESSLLHEVVVRTFAAGKPVAAICHGVVLAARSIDPVTGRSVLHGRQTTALTWALEHRAWTVARFSRFWDPSYYRTYSEEAGQSAGYMSVQQEVTRALANPYDFHDVIPGTPDSGVKSSGRARDTMSDERPAFVVEDGTYISARWPGDVNTFAKRFSSVLRSSHPEVGPSGR
jgi:putative intracellular protease/amidase